MMASPCRVVIVDDQPVFRQAARELLETRGYAVVGEASCGAEALAAVKRLAPDAVLLDVQLGDESGHDVARSLTRLDAAPAVLLVSAAEAGDAKECARACGARGFALKSRLAEADLGRFWPQPV
jgi:DNA-binding NarL/FixJ family response regulator